jgi:hypothetical protein
MSGTLGEMFAGRRFIDRMNVSRHLIPLNQLAQRFPKDKHSLLLAYEESLKFVEFITAEYGKENLRRILEFLKEGQTIEQAVLKITTKSLESLEKEWLKRVNRKRVWIIWSIQYLYEIVFFLGALLVIYASIKITIRKRRYVDEEEEEGG